MSKRLAKESCLNKRLCVQKAKRVKYAITMILFQKVRQMLTLCATEGLKIGA